MIISNQKVFLAVALLAGTMVFGACSSASTNTVSTGNTNAAGVSNTANTNKSNAVAPGNTTVAPANTTSEVKPPVKKEDMLSADTATVEKGDKIGVPECDEYIAKYEACLNGKVPAAQRDSLMVSMEQMRKGWKTAATNPQAKAALAGGCKTALATAKNSMSQYSCSW